MRVLFAVRYHLTWRSGLRSTTHWLALELERRGHETAALSFEPTAPELRVDNSLDYPVFAAPRTDLALGPVARSFGADVVVVAAVNRERSDWTQSMLERTAPLPALLYVHDVGGVELAAAAGPSLAGLAAVSDFLTAEIRAHGGEAVTVLPIVPRASYRVDSSRSVALFVNPIPQKGLETALALAGARPDVSFAFTRGWAMDDGALRELEAEARRIGSIQVRPGTDDPAELYGDARVVLVPSTYPEAWGRVVGTRSHLDVADSACLGLQLAQRPVVHRPAAGEREAHVGPGTGQRERSVESLLRDRIDEQGDRARAVDPVAGTRDDREHRHGLAPVRADLSRKEIGDGGHPGERGTGRGGELDAAHVVDVEQRGERRSGLEHRLRPA